MPFADAARGAAALIGIGITLGFGPAQAQTPFTIDFSADLLPDVPCAVRPLQTIRLASPMLGVVAKVHVRPGQQVAAGDIIAEFDTTLLASEYALADWRAKDSSMEDAALIRLEAMTQRLKRLEKALSSRAVSQAEVEAASLDRAQSQGELHRIRAEREIYRLQAAHAALSLERATVRSPVDGTVVEGLIAVGESPDVEQDVAVITVTTPLRIEAYVPAQLAPSVLAQETYFAQIGAERYELEFDYVSPVADVSSSTISVYYRLSGSGAIPGLNCSLILSQPPSR